MTTQNAMPIWLSKRETETSARSRYLCNIQSNRSIGSYAVTLRTMTMHTTSFKSPTLPRGALSKAMMSGDLLLDGFAQSRSTNAAILAGGMLSEPDCARSSHFSCPPKSRPLAPKSPGGMINCAASTLRLLRCQGFIRNLCFLRPSAAFHKKKQHNSLTRPLKRLRCACDGRDKNSNKNFHKTSSRNTVV